MLVIDSRPIPYAKTVLHRALRRLLRRPFEDNAVAQAVAIRESGMFDPTWYLERYPDVGGPGMDPALHYVRHGAEEGRNPSADFETRFYLEQYPDVAASGVNPFWHYIKFGQKEGRVARTGAEKGGRASKVPRAPSLRKPTDARIIAESGLFDGDFYLRQYLGTAPVGTDPVVHYLKYGAKEGNNPCPLFDSRFYLERYPDVAAADINPLVHFCRFGARELRDPSPSFSTGWYFLVHLGGNRKAGNPLKHYLESGQTLRLSTTPSSPIRPSEKCVLSTALSSVLNSGGVDAETFRLVGDYLFRCRLWDLAERAYQHATGLQWVDATGHQKLASAFAKQKKWWQAANALTVATELETGRASWFFQLGEAQEHMRRWQEAAAAYQSAVAIDSSNSMWHYRLGLVLQELGQVAESEKAYTNAIQLDAGLDAINYGVGVFHERSGHWELAAAAYAERLGNAPFDAELRYRLGMAHDRRYRWADAERCYRDAISLKRDVPSWHFRLGFVCERQQKWQEAASAYRAADLLSEKHTTYLSYRRGYVLAQAAKYIDACEAYIQSRYGRQQLPVLENSRLRGAPNAGVRLDDFGATEIRGAGSGKEWLHGEYLTQFSPTEILDQVYPNRAISAEYHYRLGEAKELKGDWEGAANAYYQAVSRQEDHCPGWYYSLGLACYRAGRYKDACAAFANCQIFQRPHGVSEKSAFADPETLRYMSYAEYYEVLPVKENVILYESFNGNALTCNPLAIFRRLLEDRRYSSFTHVWVVNDKSRIPAEYLALPNVVFVAKASDLYLRYLCTAKYLINNSGFPPYFIRKPEQKYLATWHGTPLKTLGKEQKYKFYDHKRTERNFLQATHIISPNPHTTNILFDSYDIRELYRGMLAETGYPRIDLVINTSEKRKTELLARLGLTGKRPIVLYAPTWRGTLEDVEFDVQRLDEDLAKLSTRDCDILFRGHSLLERVIENDSVRCKVVPPDVDTNEMLALVDVLITDYSSVFFDFLVTGRPILYYIYDQEEYEKERGLYFPVTEMPGYHCRDIDQLCVALDKALAGEIPDAEHYAQARRRYSSHDDGSATERVVNFFFDDAKTDVAPASGRRRKNILLNGGSLFPNGITTSFQNLVRHIDRQRYNVVLGFSPTGIEADPGAMEMFRRLPGGISAVPRYGNVPMSPEEYWVRRQYEACGDEPSDEQVTIVRDIFEREFTRIFGPAEFEAVVSFSGYDAFWGSVLTLNYRTCRKAIYLHNDMYGEYVAKFPELERMFRLYQYADALVSVSQQTSDLNRQNISFRFKLDPRKFVSCDNLLDPQGVFELSTEPLGESDRALFETDGPVFVNIGRLSVEKAQEKLLQAFAGFVKEYPSARLLILGSGPLRERLEQIILSLQLTSSAFLLGYRSNPYPFLVAADCFVLSSDHEGQPMTLLEALLLRKPIVATDIVGSRSVLQGRSGLLVENSVGGLLRGMRSFAQGLVPDNVFDWKAYQREALCQFDSVVVGRPPATTPAPRQSTDDIA